MSVQAREALVNGPRTRFQKQSQRDDLLNPDLTQTGLIALLTELTDKGWNIQFTAVRSDHHPDAYLGEHCHNPGGYCADLWPLASENEGDYLDASDSRFQQFLKDAAASQYLHQIGLAGSSYTDSNVEAAGPTVFHDDGADHIHLGAKN